MSDDVPDLTPKGAVLLRWLPVIIIAFAAVVGLAFRAAGLSWPQAFVVFVVFLSLMFWALFQVKRQDKDAT